MSNSHTDEALQRWSTALQCLNVASGAVEQTSLEHTVLSLTESAAALRRGAAEADQVISALTVDVKALSAALLEHAATSSAKNTHNQDAFGDIVPRLLQCLADLQGRVTAINDVWSTQYQELSRAFAVSRSEEQSREADSGKILTFENVLTTLNLQQKYEDSCARARDLEATVASLQVHIIPRPPTPTPPAATTLASPQFSSQINLLEGENSRLRAAMEASTAHSRHLEEVAEALKSDVQSLTFQNGVLCQEVNELLYQRKNAPLRSADLLLFGPYDLPKIDVVFKAEDEVVDLTRFTYADVGVLVHRNAELTRKLFAATQKIGRQESPFEVCAATPKKRARDGEEETSQCKKNIPNAVQHITPVTKTDSYVQTMIDDEPLQFINSLSSRDGYLEAMQAVYMSVIEGEASETEEVSEMSNNVLSLLRTAAERLGAEMCAHHATKAQLATVKAELQETRRGLEESQQGRLEIVVSALRGVADTLSSQVEIYASTVEAHTVQVGGMHTLFDGTSRTHSATLAALQDMSTQWVTLTNELHEHQALLLAKQKVSEDSLQGSLLEQGKALRAENAKVHEDNQRLQTALLQERQKFIDTMQNVWQMEESAQQQVLAARSVEARLTAVQDEVVRLNEELREAEGNVISIRTELEAKVAENAKQVEEIETLQAAAAGLRDQEAASQVLRMTITTLNETLQESERTREQLQADVYRLGVTMDQCRSLEVQLGRMTQTKVEDLMDTGVLSRDDVVSNLTSRLSAMTESHSALTGEVAKLRPLCANLTTQVEKLQSELDNERRQNTVLRANLTVTKEKVANDVSDKIRALRQRCEKLSEEAKTAKTSAEVATSRMLHLESKDRDMELLLQSYREQIEVLANTEETAPVRACGITLAKHLREETAKAVKAKAEAEQRLEEALKTSTVAERERARQVSLNDEERKLKTSIIATLEQKLAQRDKDIIEARQREAETKKYIEAKTAKIQELENISATVTQQVTMQADQLAQKDASLATLDEELKKMKSDNKQLNKANHTLKAKLDKAEVTAKEGGFGVGF